MLGRNHDIALSRRSFLTGMAGVGAVAALGGLAGCAPQGSGAADSAGTSKQSTVETTPPETVDATYDTDLLVVGGGGSGLACAVQAALDGTSLILVEKNNQLGGNASFVEGMFGIGSKLAEENGVSVVPADVIEKELEDGQHRQNGALWAALCAKSAENIEWCLDQGVLYSGIVDDYNGTCLYPTFHWFKGNKAAIGYVEPMTKRVQDLGIETHLETAVNQLIMKDGKVAGAYAKGPDGVVQYNAKAVVFATGGFGGNPELIAQQGWDTTNLFIVGSDKAAGDAYRMAMDAGAQDFMIDTAQSILFNIPALPPIDFHNDAMNPINGYFGIAHGGPVLWVNEHADRYTRENLTDDNLVLQCIPSKANKANYVVFNEAVFEEFFGTTDEARATFENALANDKTETLFKADSIGGLAEATGLDKAALEATVARYNELCAKGNDDDFGKKAEMMVGLDQGPYYIAQLGYSFFFETGGIVTDKQRRVIKADGEPIGGLYAIGNDGNMLYRHVYTINIGGTAFGNQVNSGREAAQNAGAYLRS